MSRPRSKLLRELLEQTPPPLQAPEPKGRRAAKRPTRRPAKRRSSFTLPVELLDELEAVCRAQGVPRRDAVEQLLRVYVAQHADLPRGRRSA